MSLFSARAAVTLIISEEVNSLVISSRSILEYVVFQPGLEQLAITADGIPIFVESVIALVVAQRIGRRSALFRYGDGADSPGRNDTGVYRSAQVVDNFLNGDDAALGCQHRFFLHADNTFHQHVALAVSTLGVNDRHIRPDRRDRRQTLTGKGALDELDLIVDLGQITADVAAQYRQREPGGASLVSIGHGRVAMLDQLESARPALLDGIAQAM